MRSLLLAATMTAALTLVPTAPAMAELSFESEPAIQNGFKLARHADAVRYQQEARMWSCWTPGTRPRLSAWNGRQWVQWATAERVSGFHKCAKGSDTVVFSFYTSLLGSHVKDRAYHLLRVKEHCRGCDTAAWTLPVLPKGAQAG